MQKYLCFESPLFQAVSLLPAAGCGSKTMMYHVSHLYPNTDISSSGSRFFLFPGVGNKARTCGHSTALLTDPLTPLCHHNIQPAGSRSLFFGIRGGDGLRLANPCENADSPVRCPTSAADDGRRLVF